MLRHRGAAAEGWLALLDGDAGVGVAPLRVGCAGCGARGSGGWAHGASYMVGGTGCRLAPRHGGKAARCTAQAARCRLQAAWRTARGLYLQPVGDNVLVEQRQHVRLVAQQHVGAARSRAQPADAGASTQLKNPLTAQ